MLDEAHLLAPIQPMEGNVSGLAPIRPIEGNVSGLAAVRYVERNPVRAGLVTAAEKWPWSSASAHGSRRDDLLVKVAPMLERIGDWVGYLAALEDEAVLEALRRHERTGRVLGAEPFIDRTYAVRVGRAGLNHKGTKITKSAEGFPWEHFFVSFVSLWLVHTHYVTPVIETLEATLARPLRPGKPGPRPRKNRD